MDVETAGAAQPAGAGPGRGAGKAGSRRRAAPARVADPLLRFLQLCLACCALAVILASGTATVLLQDVDAFSFLVAGTSIATFWALLTLLLSCIELSGGALQAAWWLTAFVIGDFVALAFALSSGAAALAVATTLLLPPSMFVRARAAASLAVIAAASFLPSAALDVLRLAGEAYVAE